MLNSDVRLRFWLGQGAAEMLCRRVTTGKRPYSGTRLAGQWCTTILGPSYHVEQVIFDTSIWYCLTLFKCRAHREEFDYW
jgi:hypothetical protein